MAVQGRISLVSVPLAPLATPTRVGALPIPGGVAASDAQHSKWHEYDNVDESFTADPEVQGVFNSFDEAGDLSLDALAVTPPSHTSI